MSLQKAGALRDDRAGVIEKMQALTEQAEAEGRGLTEEEKASWDKMDAEQESLRSRAERLEREHDLAKEMDESGKRHKEVQPGREDSRGDSDDRDDPKQKRERENEAFTAFLRWGMNGIDEEQRSILRGLRAQLSPAEVRAQSTTDSAGGYTIPEGFSNQLEQAMLEFGGMREAAMVMPTASGNDLPWPTVNDTSNKGALLAENTQDSEQDLTFGVVTLGAYKYTSKIVRVSVELLQDSAFDMNAFLSDALGTRLARITNEHFTTGTGSSQPNGAVTASTAGVTAASSSAITHDELLDLKHSVDPAYRRSPSTRWMMNDTTLKVLKKLKDSESRPLWMAGVALREPDTIDGDRYVINQDMASSEASSKPLLYGDFSKYIIRDVRAVTLVRLVERYADFHQVGFIAFLRADGDLIDAGTNPIKHLIHPSP